MCTSCEDCIGRQTGSKKRHHFWKMAVCLSSGSARGPPLPPVPLPVPSPHAALTSPHLPPLLALFLFSTIATLADTAHVSGTIFTIDPNRVQSLWPNARITLKNLATKRELTTVSNDLGQYSFSGILPGEYEISVTLAGFASASRRITLTAAAPPRPISNSSPNPNPNRSLSPPIIPTKSTFPPVPAAAGS